MRVTLLGTGADHCIPAFRCNCPVCVEARSIGIKRQNSAAAIELSDGNLVLIDMPPQIMLMLRDYGISDTQISHVLVTHRHGDHTLGLRYLFHGSERKEFSVERPVKLHISRFSFQSISKTLLAEKNYDLFPERTDFYSIDFIEAYKSFSINNLEITPVETNHLKAKGRLEEDSLGFVVRDMVGKKVFVYLLDASKNLPNATIELIEGLAIDCLVTECTYDNAPPESGHLDVEGVIEFHKRFNPKRTVVSHISHKNFTLKQLEDIFGRYSIDIGYDGMSCAV